MKFSCGFWIPDNDNHFVDRGPNYQKSIRDIALGYVENWNLAVDVGAHCGFWANTLARHFASIAAFEPEKDNRECLDRNTGMNVTVFPYALGERPSYGLLNNPAPENSGAWELNACATDGNVTIRTLDSFALDPGLIKIDTQGYEKKVLMGGEKTLRACSPIVVVEDNGDGAIGFLESLGYMQMARVRRDVVMAK